MKRGTVIPALRILDLGAHDGFVSAHVADVVAEDIDLHIDGVELNPKAVEIANRRLQERMVRGEFKVGLAEDAPELFPTETYDVVIAFELIEHVLDPDAFLTICDRMCNDEGRVYISTPDGTFGEGQNPNHLRVIRLIDLCDLARRHGNVQGALAGADTIGVLSYRPEPLRDTKGDLAIFLGPAMKQWSARDIETPGVGLGGSETAAVRLAEEMDRMGFHVTVYAEVEGGMIGQVIYRHWTTFDPLEPRAVVIGSRTPQLFTNEVSADRKILWMHDTDYGLSLTEEVFDNVDAVMVLSEWHHEHACRTYPFMRGSNKLQVTGNAIKPDYFLTGRPAAVLADTLHHEGEEIPEATIEVNGKTVEAVRDITRFGHRAIYSSSPDRGLDFLVSIWPQVREHLPDAELVCCYADVYDAMADARPELKAFRQKLATMIDETEGVYQLGSLAQPELVSTMERCGVWLNPGWNGVYNVPFYETYCIGAVEAAAAGCALIGSRHGALIERMQIAQNWRLLDLGGTVTEPRPSPELWVPSIVGMMVGEADDPTVPSDAALDTTWDLVARDFAQQILTSAH